MIGEVLSLVELGVSTESPEINLVPLGVRVFTGDQKMSGYSSWFELKKKSDLSFAKMVSWAVCASSSSWMAAVQSTIQGICADEGAFVGLQLDSTEFRTKIRPLTFLGLLRASFYQLQGESSRTGQKDLVLSGNENIKETLPVTDNTSQSSSDVELEEDSSDILFQRDVKGSLVLSRSSKLGYVSTLPKAQTDEEIH
ncbi:unnamed protein product [Arabis nemorensis]|uniref:Uncharacterized protein n=1 Tax=Arabis nemorensis TaxID=586526 RepID=A0A565AVV9_9BRAS|nr:unnamed protein product [Arabis nemorensis]